MYVFPYFIKHRRKSFYIETKQIDSNGKLINIYV